VSRGALVVVIAAALAAAFGAGLCKVADLDFWWHLETGELIAKTGQIPREDVFSFTAQGREYIDHEWLFQLSQFWIYETFGPAGIAVAKSLLIALTLSIAGWYALRRGAGSIASIGLLFLSVAGGITRFIERPEIFTILFAVITWVLLDEFVRSGDRRLLIAIPFIAALWANVHAAVIVGIAIQGLVAASLFFEERRRFVPVAVTGVASIIACLANPFGYRVLTVPFELTRIIESGVVNNEEWRSPDLYKTPVFFLLLAMTAAFLILAARERRWRSIFVGVFLGYISLRYIRNVNLFSTFVPLLIAPEVASLRRAWKGVLFAVGAAFLLLVLTVRYPFERGFGVASYFPDRIAAWVEREDLRGHMMNSYSMGGYLIWALYPERQIFIDGRNEVFLPLMERLVAARSDSRAWTALLGDYRIEYAILEYVDTLDRVTTIGRDGKVTQSFAPISATRFPRSRWALVYFDDDGMIFIRRDGVNRGLLGHEYTAVYPEGAGYQRFQVESGAVNRDRAVAELHRRLREDPSSRRAAALLRSMNQNR
jgi:hypothetical protein